MVRYIQEITQNKHFGSLFILPSGFFGIETGCSIKDPST